MTTTVMKDEPGRSEQRSNPTVGLKPAVRFKSDRVDTIFFRFERALHDDQSPAGESRHVPRDAGGRHHHPVHPDGSVPDDQRPEAGRAVAAAQDGHRPSDQLPGRRGAGVTRRP